VNAERGEFYAETLRFVDERQTTIELMREREREREREGRKTYVGTPISFYQMFNIVVPESMES
jgi:hypothetical protein